MATIGQCRACRGGVSDEATTCPRCGQPQPCLLIPAPGYAYCARVDSITNVGDYGERYVQVTLSNGITGDFTVTRSDPPIRVGDHVDVQVTGNREGTVFMGLARSARPLSAGCALLLPLLTAVVCGVVVWGAA